MTPIKRHYNKMMDRAIKELEKKLQNKLGFVSPDKMQEVVKVRQMPPANRLGQKHMELDLTHTVYLMNNEPILEYRFYAIATKFDFAIVENKGEKKSKTRTGSDVPLLYGADGDVISVVEPSGREGNGD